MDSIYAFLRRHTRPFVSLARRNRASADWAPYFIGLYIVAANMMQFFFSVIPPGMVAPVLLFSALVPLALTRLRPRRRLERYPRYFIEFMLLFFTTQRVAVAAFTGFSLFALSLVSASLAALALLAGSRALFTLVVSLAVAGQAVLAAPHVSIETLYYLPALVALPLWIFALASGRAKLPRDLVSTTLLLLALGLVPLKEGRFVKPSDAQVAAITTQPGVEVLFDNNAGPPFPKERMELLCEPQSGIRIVTPHGRFTNIVFMHPNGEVKHLDVHHESPDKSVIKDGLLITTSDGSLLRIDPVAGRVVRTDPIGAWDVFYMHPMPSGSRVLVSEDRPIRCYIVDTNNPTNLRELPRKLSGNECVPLSGNRVLSSPVPGGGHLGVGDLETFELIARYPDFNAPGLGLGIQHHAIAVFHQVAVDEARNRAYLPSELSGDVHVFDLRALTPIHKFYASSGVRSLLPDPNDAGRVFSWNYATGQVIEHQMPSGIWMRTWTLGPLLRTLNWDCDGKSLIAATSVGGFRIRLE